MNGLVKSATVLSIAIVLCVGSLEARGSKGSHHSQETGTTSFKIKGSSLKFLSELDLTTTQEEQIQALVEVSKANMVVYNEENPKKDLVLSALSENGFDTAIYITDATERFETTIAMQAEFLQAVMEVLTSAQRITLEELIVAAPTVSESVSYARERLSR